MNKRLRKKKHKGEFACIGFNVIISLHPSKWNNDRDKRIDKFVKDLIDLSEKNNSLNMTFGGGGNNETMNWLFEPWKRKANCGLTENHQRIIDNFICKNSDLIRAYSMGPLFDVFYNWSEKEFDAQTQLLDIFSSDQGPTQTEYEFLGYKFKVRLLNQEISTIQQ